MNSIKQDLPAPSVDGVVDGVLDPAGVPASGATARITNVPVSWGGTTLTLYLEEVQGAILYQTTWPVSSHGRDINLPIPKAVLVSNTDKDVQVHYSVSSIGDSLPLVFKLGSAFGGAAELDLSSHNYMVAYTNSVARPPLAIPLFARLQRVLPGATSYSSSDETIAKVDEFGIVTAQCNGRVTISASGAPGGPASYELTITGIHEFQMVSAAADWTNAGVLLATVGLSRPSALDFDRLRTYYPLPIGHYLGLPNYEVWGEALGAGTAHTFNLNTGDSSSTDISTLLQVAGVKQGNSRSRSH